MKILFINPPSETPFEKDDPYYPLGLLYLASILEKEGHKVLVKDYFKDSWNNVKDEIIRIVKNYSPDIVGLSCVTMNRISCFKLSRITKKINSRIKIIMGGAHTISLYEQILLNHPIDVIVIGEGEITTPKLIKALEKNKSLKKVKGVAFKDNGKVRFTGFRKHILELDEIPFPKHELFREKIKKTKTATIITSRGCPFKCIFCSTSKYWGRCWRSRSAKNVVDEIEYLIEKFPYLEKIIFPDDTFILDNQRVINICNELLKRKIKINWQCAGRLDRVSEEMLRKMKKAGCKLIAYGIESGSPKMLKIIKKNITQEQIIKAIELTNKVSLNYGTFFMVGNPGESWETVKETVSFNNKLKNLEIREVGKLQR